MAKGQFPCQFADKLQDHRTQLGRTHLLVGGLVCQETIVGVRDLFPWRRQLKNHRHPVSTAKSAARLVFSCDFRVDNIISEVG